MLAAAFAMEKVNIATRIQRLHSPNSEFRGVAALLLLLLKKKLKESSLDIVLSPVT